MVLEIEIYKVAGDVLFILKSLYIFTRYEVLEQILDPTM